MTIIKTVIKNKKIIINYIFLIIAVCIGGEFQFYPLNDNVRISFGTPIFFFFLLWSKHIKPISSGLLVGISVVMFRTTLSSLGMESLYWLENFQIHAHVFSYYFTYGLLFHFFKPLRFYNRPIIIAFIGMIMESLSNLASVSSRYIYLGEMVTLETLLTMFLVSFIRSFLVLSIFSFFLLREANAAEAIYRRQNNEMLLLVSDLYVEMVQLEKSMKNVELTTRQCYELYKCLMDSNNKTFAKKALRIAGEVHEIKKDHQRIHAGLSKLKVKEQTSGLMEIEKIIKIAVKSNENYAKQLNKKIDFDISIFGYHPFYNNFTVLSLINNLITNSVEAIEEQGKISILVEQENNYLIVLIKDNGPGIPLNKQSLVFEPGYTTKYDEIGLASNGIGLSHIKEVINNLDGKIDLYSNPNKRETTFNIQLPINNINYSR